MPQETEEEEAYISDGSDSAVELIDSEEDEPGGDMAYVESEATDDGEDDENLSEGDEEAVAPTVPETPTVPEAPPVVPVAPRPRGKKAAVVKRGRCNRRRDDIPKKYKRKLVALFEARFPGPFDGPMAVKKAIAGSKILRELQQALHKLSGGRCKVHNIEQFTAWLGKDLRGSKCRSKRKNISGEHQDIETLTFAY